MSFKWAVLSVLQSADVNAERISKYVEFSNDLNFKDISFPVKLSDSPKFKKN